MQFPIDLLQFLNFKNLNFILIKIYANYHNDYVLTNKDVCFNL